MENTKMQEPEKLSVSDFEKASGGIMPPEKSPATYYCRSCGAPVPFRATQCPNCGANKTCLV